MEYKAGEGDFQMVIRIAGFEYDVIPAKDAAIMAGYSHEHMCRLCDEGKILADKVAGVWWVQVWQLETVQKD